MNTKLTGTVLASVLAIAAASGTAMAQRATGQGCLDMQWHPDLLRALPRIAVACQEVAVKDGRKFARFRGRVTENGTDRVTVEFMNVAGTPGRPVTLLHDPKATVQVNGKDVPYKSLRRGDEMTFWVPESRIGVFHDPGAAEVSTLVLN